MALRQVLGERSGESQRPVESGITSQLEIGPGLGGIALRSRLAILIVDLAQPARVWRLVESAGTSRDPRAPPPCGRRSREAGRTPLPPSSAPRTRSRRRDVWPGPARRRVSHPADPFEQRHVVGVACAQHADRREVERLLRVRQPRFEFPEPRRELGPSRWRCALAYWPISRNSSCGSCGGPARLIASRYSISGLRGDGPAPPGALVTAAADASRVPARRMAAVRAAAAWSAPCQLLALCK